MSFVSVKRQLSADLERYSSRKKQTYTNPRNSSQKLPVRHLGDVTPSARFRSDASSSSRGSNRRFSESTQREPSFHRPLETVSTIPQTPPASRESIHISQSHHGFLKTNKWFTNNEETELSTSENNSKSSDSHFWSQVLSPGRQNVPGVEIPPDHLLPEGLPIGALCCASSSPSWKTGNGLGVQVPLQRKRPSVKVVVHVPKIDVGNTAIVFSYRHGDVRTVKPRFYGRKIVKEY